MPDETPKTNLVTLTCGALNTLNGLLANPGWTKVSKEKHAAGKMMLKFEDVIAAQPDAPTVSPGEPGFYVERQKWTEASKKWDRAQAPAIELSDLQFSTAQSCIKHSAAKEETGQSRWFAELQEAFRCVE
jgi:hypothetical protein